MDSQVYKNAGLLEFKVDARLIIVLVLLRLFLEPINAYRSSSNQMFLFYFIPISFVGLFILLFIQDRNFANFTNQGSTLKFFGVIFLYQVCISAYSFKWKFSTEKNEVLLKRIIEMATSPHDWVLDSFAGSGTTGKDHA